MSKISWDWEDRFHSKYQKLGSDECWEWQTALSTNGYGRFAIAGKSRIASRVSFELEFGEIQDGLCVLHSCDNRACVNPKHLRLGTIADNSKDMVDRFRCPNQVMSLELKVRATELLQSGLPQKDVAAVLGVKKGVIQKTSAQAFGARQPRGYSWHERDKRYVARICIGGVERHLGSFVNEADARAAYEQALQSANGGQTAGVSHPSAISSPGAQ